MSATPQPGGTASPLVAAAARPVAVASVLAVISTAHELHDAPGRRELRDAIASRLFRLAVEDGELVELEGRPSEGAEGGQ